MLKFNYKKEKIRKEMLQLSLHLHQGGQTLTQKPGIRAGLT